MKRTIAAMPMATVAVAARPCAGGHGYAWRRSEAVCSKQQFNLTDAKPRRLRRQPT